MGQYIHSCSTVVSIKHAKGQRARCSAENHSLFNAILPPSSGETAPGIHSFAVPLEHAALLQNDMVVTIIVSYDTTVLFRVRRSRLVLTPNTLYSTDFCDNNFLVWVGDIASTDGFTAANHLQACHCPIAPIASLCFTEMHAFRVGKFLPLLRGGGACGDWPDDYREAGRCEASALMLWLMYQSPGHCVRSRVCNPAVGMVITTTISIAITIATIMAVTINVPTSITAAVTQVSSQKIRPWSCW